MLAIDFLEGMSDEEINNLTKIFKILSRDIHWKIIRELKKESPLRRCQLIERTHNTNITENIKFLIENGIVYKENINSNPYSKRATFHYFLDRFLFDEIAENLSNETGLHYEKMFELSKKM